MTTSREKLLTLRLGLLLFLLVGCGYGDETPDQADTTPPLVQMEAVNRWLAAYKAKFGTVPATYEELKAAWEATGRRWPRFTRGGTWVYLPHRARVIEVRESWVRAWLKNVNRRLADAPYHLYNLQRVKDYFRRKEGIDVIFPGYKIVFKYSGSQAYLDIATTEDGFPIRANHTASPAFDVDKQGRLVVVPGALKGK